MVWGGFPKRLKFDNEALKRYLEDLDETIIYKDIILRYDIRKEDIFRAVAYFILRSNSRILSYNSRQKILITNDEIDYSTSTVRHIKFKEFLLMENFV